MGKELVYVKLLIKITIRIKMERIDRKLDAILEKLAILEVRLQRLELSCRAMDSHIGFVEGVYSTVRAPMDYVASKVSQLTGGSHTALPPSKNQDDNDEKSIVISRTQPRTQLRSIERCPSFVG